MQKNKRRGNGGHSFRAGPYDRPQNESGGRGCGRGRGRGVVRGRRGRGGYTPYAAGGRGRGFVRGRGAGAGGPNFYEGPGRAADPAFRVGDYSNYDNSQQWYRQWDGGDGYGYQEYDDCQQWGQQVDEEDGYGYHGNEQEAPSYGSPAQ
ncbi:hypothetical protein FOWG_06413 [Fusarium oxysporum f. sp. lycopersici MN25]|uniref:Uncharacterized protein n=1 Tax=Fusarium oxysporum Fo47 TaxID=660027 RepID=W9L0Z8_FUSOX|nr:hypothetical protein FOZG_04174 [Fusarium oxysporum Fo47]EWZ93753.1 hypothetical protein FOWG_06413 [Fusarium oxysporum f. sp. lycopersici MN25]RKK53157.1 hypothetical protein BFJ66_g5300 [Fusarium oxysporum f. sp. cepae]